MELRIDRNGPQLRMRDDDCDPRYRECRERMRRDDRDRYREGRRDECDRSRRKADRMGIRRARVVDVGRRTIDVAGRDRRGDRIIVSFGRRRYRSHTARSRYMVSGGSGL